jgi:hypothetical protein
MSTDINQVATNIGTTIYNNISPATFISKLIPYILSDVDDNTIVKNIIT